MLVERVEGEPVLPRVERLDPTRAGKLGDRRRSARPRTSAALPSCAASEEASQSMPGAFASKSARLHTCRALGEVLAVGARRLGAGDLDLEIEDALCARLRRRDARRPSASLVT